MHNTPVTVVVIGRNEGDRLRSCLESIHDQRIVYVDSGSTDSSVECAHSRGVSVVELDMTRPFSAARARNNGFEKAVIENPSVKFIQFVDGDCQITRGWIDTASEYMETHLDVAAVAGRLREKDPHRSIYNRLCDLEWNTPVGIVEACGGVAMYRVSAFEQVGGFNETVIAGEEPELCLRLRKSGWRIHRLDIDMGLHDAAMTNFQQWWRRAVRGGYGALDVATRFETRGNSDAFSKQIRSARIWAIGWTILLAIAIVWVIFSKASTASLFAAASVAAILPLQMVRIAVKALPKCGKINTALAYGCLMMIEKWANVTGQFRYLRDRRSKQAMAVMIHTSVECQTTKIRES
jgi:GT2 family glycosyltransferase